MKVYKSSLFVRIKNVIYGIFGGAILAWIANWFLRMELAIAIGVAAFLLIAYFALVGDNIKIIVEGDFFAVHKRGKEKYRFNYKEVGIHANIKTDGTDSDCLLTIEEANGKQTQLDCSMLGRSRFYKLLDSLQVTDAQPMKVATTKKGGK